MGNCIVLSKKNVSNVVSGLEHEFKELSYKNNLTEEKCLKFINLLADCTMLAKSCGLIDLYLKIDYLKQCVNTKYDILLDKHYGAII